MKRIPFVRQYGAAASVPPRSLDDMKPADRRLLFTAGQDGKEQAVQVIEKLALNGPIPPDELWALTREAIESGLGLNSPEIINHINAVARQERRKALSTAEFSTAPALPLSGDHLEFLERHLVPADKIDFLVPIDEILLNNDLHWQVEALNFLYHRSKRFDDPCYDWVTQGKLGNVLANLKAGHLPGYDPKWLRRIVRNQARCLAWFIACGHVRLIRRLATKPYDTLVAGFNTWPTLAHWYLTTLSATALLAVDMAAKWEEGDTSNKFADNVETWLKSNGYFTNDEKGEKILSNAKNIGVLLSYKHGPNAALDLAKGTYQSSKELLNNLSNVRIGHMKDLKWTRKTYPELRLGVSASEGTAFVADQLRQALGRIDELMDLPRCSRLDANYKLCHLGTLLRGIIEPDKNSAQIGQPRDGSDPDIRVPDPYTNAGAQPFKKLQKKLKSSKLRKKLEIVLGIKVDRWMLAQN